MQDEVDSGASLVHGVEIDNVGLAKVDTIEDLGEVFAVARGQVVDAAHLIAAREHGAGQRRSDEAGNASYQVERHDPSS